MNTRRSSGRWFPSFENWKLLFADERMWEALGTTLFYFAVVLTVEVVLGMAIALLLDAEEFGFGLLRTVLTLTLVVPRPSWG